MDQRPVPHGLISNFSPAPSPVSRLQQQPLTSAPITDSPVNAQELSGRR